MPLIEEQNAVFSFALLDSQTEEICATVTFLIFPGQFSD